jgi:dUTP pyrophosphatase
MPQQDFVLGNLGRIFCCFPIHPRSNGKEGAHPENFLKMDFLKFTGSTSLQRATPGSAGYDLVSDETAELAAGHSRLFSTGLKIALPNGTVGFIKSRSSLASKFNVEVGAGVIDSDYRGEVKVLLRNLGHEPFHVTSGMRIAQLVILPIVTPDFIMVRNEHFELDITDRGSGGFGSTGM